MNEKPTISTHYDTGAVITADSNPVEEFALWQAHAAANPADWRGDEFTLVDFETYIANL